MNAWVTVRRVQGLMNEELPIEQLKMEADFERLVSKTEADITIVISEYMDYYHRRFEELNSQYLHSIISLMMSPPLPFQCSLCNAY